MRSTLTTEGFEQVLMPDTIPDYARFYASVEENNEA